MRDFQSLVLNLPHPGGPPSHHMFSCQQLQVEQYHHTQACPHPDITSFHRPDSKIRKEISSGNLTCRSGKAGVPSLGSLSSHVVKRPYNAQMGTSPRDQGCDWGVYTGVGLQDLGGLGEGGETQRQLRDSLSLYSEQFGWLLCVLTNLPHPAGVGSSSQRAQEK